MQELQHHDAMFRQVIEDPRGDAGLRSCSGVVVLIVAIHGQQFGALARHTYDVRRPIHIHPVIDVRQPARKRLDGNCLPLPFFDLSNGFFDQRHSSLRIIRTSEVLAQTSEVLLVAVIAIPAGFP